MALGEIWLTSRLDVDTDCHNQIVPVYHIIVLTLIQIAVVSPLLQ